MLYILLFLGSLGMGAFLGFGLACIVHLIAYFELRSLGFWGSLAKYTGLSFAGLAALVASVASLLMLFPTTVK
jgi:hypothetical protein